MLLAIAWKNIWRNKVRSLIIIFAIVVGLFGGLFSSAFMNGMVLQRIDSAIENECSNIQVHHPEFSMNKELNDTIQSLDTLKSVLDTMSEVTGWTARLKITAMANISNFNSGVNIYGIDPDKEKSVTGIWKYIPDSMGSWLTNDKANKIIIGAKLAEKLKISLKSKIIMKFQAADNTIATGEFRVIGIYKTGNTFLEEQNVYVRYNDLLPLLGFSNENAHEIAIALNSDLNNDKVKAILQKKFPHLKIESWKEIMPDLGLMSELTTQMLYIILVIIILALCFGIVNTMLMAVMERTHEIGMLMAIGMTKAKIFQMILLETVLLSLLGGILGMLIGALVIHYFSVVGFSLAAFTKGLEAMGYSTLIFPNLDNSFYLGLTILVIIAGIFSSFLPARKALGLNPVDAIRTK